MSGDTAAAAETASSAWVHKLSVRELKEEMFKRGLPTGNVMTKPERVKLLEAHIQAHKHSPREIAASRAAAQSKQLDYKQFGHKELAHLTGRTSISTSPAELGARDRRPAILPDPPDNRWPSTIKRAEVGSQQFQEQMRQGAEEKRQQQRESFDSLLRQRGFHRRVLLKAEEAGTEEDAVIYYSVNGVLNPGQLEAASAAAAELIPPDHSRFQEGFTHAHVYAKKLDATREGRIIINMHRSGYMDIFKAGFRVPSAQVVARGGGEPGPHRSGAPGLLDSAHQDENPLFFGAGREVDSWRYLGDLAPELRPMKFYTLEGQKATEILTIKARSIFMSAAAAGAGKIGIVLHERQALDGHTFGMDIVRADAADGAPLRIDKSPSYYAFLPSLAARTPESLAFPTSRRGNARGNALENAQRRASEAAAAAATDSESTEEQQEGGSDEAEDEEPHCGFCLSSNVIDQPFYVVNDLLYCPACKRSADTSLSDVAMAERPSVTHGGHRYEGCPGCSRVGAVSNPQRAGWHPESGRKRKPKSQRLTPAKSQRAAEARLQAAAAAKEAPKIEGK